MIVLLDVLCGIFGNHFFILRQLSKFVVKNIRHTGITVFFSLQTPEEAATAIQIFDGFKLKGRILQAKIAQSEQLKIVSRRKFILLNGLFFKAQNYSLISSSSFFADYKVGYKLKPVLYIFIWYDVNNRLSGEVIMALCCIKQI